MKPINAFTGKKQFFDYYAALEKELSKNDFYYAFAFQGEYQSLEIKNFLKQFHAKLAKKEVDDRAIFSKELESTANTTYSGNSNLKIKYKNFDIPVGLVITKDRIVQLGWKPEPFIVEIRNKHLFKHYLDFFMENWNANEAIEFTKGALGKLDYRFDGGVLKKIDNLRDYKKAIAVAEAIEEIEDSWEYEYQGKGRQFGQKVVGETIKLWSVPKTTAELLQFLAVATKSKAILEIGTSAGYSTLYLAMGADYNKGKVYTIEKLKAKASLARRNFKKSGLANIELLEGDAAEFLNSGKIKNLDLIFLDADKENYGKYFELFMPKLNRGGFIVADNVFDYGHMMKDYLDKVLGTKLPNSQSDKRVVSYTLPIDNGVIITRKIKD